MGKRITFKIWRLSSTPTPPFKKQAETDTNVINGPFRCIYTLNLKTENMMTKIFQKSSLRLFSFSRSSVCQRRNIYSFYRPITEQGVIESNISMETKIETAIFLSDWDTFSAYTLYLYSSYYLFSAFNVSMLAIHVCLCVIMHNTRNWGCPRTG